MMLIFVKKRTWLGVVGEMVRSLQIFYDATLGFFISLRVTSSNCYNEICKVEKVLNSMSKNVDPHLLIVATILDPRSKMNFIVVFFESLYGKDTAKCGEIKSIVKNT